MSSLRFLSDLLCSYASTRTDTYVCTSSDKWPSHRDKKTLTRIFFVRQKFSNLISSIGMLQRANCCRLSFSSWR